MDVVIYLENQSEPANLETPSGIANFKVGDLIKVEQNDIFTIEHIVKYYTSRYEFASKHLQKLRLSFYMKDFDKARSEIEFFKKVLQEASAEARKMGKTDPSFQEDPDQFQKVLQFMQQEYQIFDQLFIFFGGYEKKEKAYEQKKIRTIYVGLNQTIKNIQKSLNGNKNQKAEANSEVVNSTTKRQSFAMDEEVGVRLNRGAFESDL